MNDNEYQIAVATHWAMAKLAEAEVGDDLTARRWEKAISGMKNGTMKIVDTQVLSSHQTLYFVSSKQSGVPNEYVVARNKNGEYGCSCPDFLKNSHRSGHLCKHIMFVIATGAASE